MSKHKEVIDALQSTIDSFCDLWFWERWLNTTAYRTAVQGLTDAYRAGTAALEHAYVDLDDWREIQPRLAIALKLLGVEK